MSELKRAIDIAERCGCVVAYWDKDYSAVKMTEGNTTQEIFLERGNDEHITICALLHEVGHVLDFKEHENLYFLYMSRPLFKIEARAWEIAVQLAKKFNFDTLSPDYIAYCLNSYADAA